jgi:hypothetical protein
MAEPTTFTLPDDAAPKIKALYAYWLSIRPAGGLLPARRHFDPLDIPELLPNIWMIDVRRDPLRFRFRLIGTEVVRFTGRDATGRWLDEVYPNYRSSDAYHVHCAVAESSRPRYRKSGVLSNPNRKQVTAERLYLPLADDGRNVDIVLVMTLHSGEPPPRRRP